MSSKSRFKGCLLGSALGDAVGELSFECRDEGELKAKLREKDRLRYTDDTAMAIGLAESLIEKKGEIDQEHIGETFKENYKEEPWRGYGQGPPKIFKMVEKGKRNYVECAETLFGGEGSKGNGSAMRIAPVGVFFSISENVYEKAIKTAEVTHAHPLGKDGAGVLALCIGRASLSDKISPEDFALDMAERSETEVFGKKLKKVAELLKSEVEREEAAQELGSSVLIEKSVPYAIFSFLKDPKSYEKALMNAVLVSGDSDTIGAMTGAVSGAYLGDKALPEAWVDKLENVSYLKKLSERLFELRKE
ncbi:MAG: ADP-ribosylglycohydrolase family protein [Candidatus Thermoplasmatota archaeon]|nr:ADP-ribosylglycohydrolase family protein [Candidatus Thermoplasmatota archaeon]